MTDPVGDALLPPAVLAILALVLLAAGRRRSAALVLAALVLFSVQGVPHLLIAPLLLPYAAPPSTPPGAVVVLAGSMPGLLDTSGTSPSLDTLERLRVAAALSRRTGRPILVSGARAADGPRPLAASMALSLEQDFGVRATWTETTSTNLWQSAAASAATLRPAGIDSVYLVAQPWELRLSTSVFRAAGLAVTPAPIPTSQQRPLDLSALIAVTPAWLDSTLALGQWVGLTCQAMVPCATWMAGPTPGPN